MKKIRIRWDYPLCPYCLTKVAGFVPSGAKKKITLYCTSAKCRGRSLSGAKNGYDIPLFELTTPVKSARVLPRL